MMLVSEIPFKSDDPSIAGIEGKRIQGDIKRSPPTRTTESLLDLKRHASDVRYQAPPFLACVEKIGETGDEARECS